ncbi:MAG: alpha/beta hydrolase [Anaerolineaceae bacterium]|nr:alpha/beta hydrolase [Anaerolineaceae bacterium]
MSKDWTQGTVKVDDGIELFYTRTGKGEKPAIVLAHGITDNGLCWGQLAADLEADYDLILYDAYGHGKSSRFDPEKRFDMVEDMHDLIQALDLKKPGVIGHSMGAATAAGFAARYPGWLSCLVLEDPPWTDTTFTEKQVKEGLENWKNGNLAAKEKTVKELIQAKEKDARKWETAILEPWAESKLEMDPDIFDHYPQEKPDWREIAKAIEVPTLLIAGDPDLNAIVTPKLGIEAIEIMGFCEYGHISGAGHCVRYEQYKPYLTMVKLFLKRNLPI